MLCHHPTRVLVVVVYFCCGVVVLLRILHARVNTLAVVSFIRKRKHHKQRQTR